MSYSSQLKKAILQVRYIPKLDFTEKIRETAKALESEYPDWQMSPPDIVVTDSKKHCSVGFNSIAVAYSQDSGDSQLEEERIQSLVAKMPGFLGKSKAVRFGYRRLLVTSVNFRFEELVRIVMLKMFSTTPKLDSVLPSITTDVLYRTDGEEGDNKFRVTIAPVKKAELPKLLDVKWDLHYRPTERVSARQEVNDRYPEVAMFFDVDVFRSGENLPIEKLSSFVTSARVRLMELVEGVNTYLFNASLED